MIISHKHRFIYFAIPKTGTHAIRRGLRPHLEENDWEQVELFERKRFPLAHFESINHGHITAEEIKAHLTSAQWEGYFKFSFLRNPFERFVSTCFFRFGRNSIFQNNPSAYMKLLFQTKKELSHLLFAPQVSFISDQSGNIVLDFMGDFARLQLSFNSISQRFGWSENTLKRVNTSKHGPSELYYDDELKSLVSDYYSSDIKLYSRVVLQNS